MNEDKSHLLSQALPVTAIGGEVVIGGANNPSLTPAAARETAKRLIAAADDAELTLSDSAGVVGAGL